MSSNVRYAAKRDANEPEIIKALRKIGCLVEQLNGTNIPDLLVIYSGTVHLMEVKDGKAKLTEGQERWHCQSALHGVSVDVVRTVEEAINLVTKEK